MSNKRKTTPGLPTEINILGTPYKIEYVDSPIDADLHNRKPCFGQIDWVTSTIRIYVGDRTPEAVKKVLFHEIIHGIMMEFQVMELAEVPDDIHERVVENIATGIYDTLTRNNLLVEM